ncbi:hypothetical protein TVAG_067780 [Trichomonas vaginalis G3]|uniref:Uncharacterized protein n=1 Tax=Trichomonas vaginalis (strain ATCC PRA-98 / G3) TaxID=412133 RepID=A2EMG2_TRIV3|nr:hypothetical protein TVAGG3_0499110 [Trichomonas vaginalis G3]EAY06118.1 hypothetical protein TVAG_067780 [Trichomonas vaginalis G3]KAI5516941.1 hypothetical protein TVAGG3_0499110 [Trichomonas vaginalis G3]|eukprot:XP_001318341.1 hypothetical protein [Trichomonas vaginalis G3]
MDKEDEMPLPYIKALTHEIKETKQIVAEAQEHMYTRKRENQEYYEPATALLNSVKNTRQELIARAYAVISMIDNETQQLKEIKEQNSRHVHELQLTSDVLNQESDEETDNPLGIAVRAIGTMFPFIVFGLYTICSK